MSRYAVLLRGINLGRARKLPMAQLRELLTGQGYGEVRTHLQSGNVVLSAPETTPDRLAADIERAIAERFGMDVPCLVRDRAELLAVVDGNPFADVADNGSLLMAMFLSEPLPPAALASHDPVTLDPDNVAVGDRVVYQWCPKGFRLAPAVAPYLEKHHGVAVTVRNWNTVTKLATLLTQ